MSPQTELVQHIGSFVFAFIAIVTIWVSSNLKHWCDYGQETGMITGSCLLFLATTRLARTEFGIIGLNQNTVINAYVLMAHGAIISVVVGLHLARHYYLRTAKRQSILGK